MSDSDPESVTVGLRLAAVARISLTNFGGRRYLTLADHAAERPLCLKSCLTALRGR